MKISVRLKLTVLGFLKISLFPARRNIIELNQPTYSPALALCEFSFPQAQRDDQVDPFWRRVDHQVGHNNGAEGQKSFPFSA